MKHLTDLWNPLREQNHKQADNREGGAVRHTGQPHCHLVDQHPDQQPHDTHPSTGATPWN